MSKFHRYVEDLLKLFLKLTILLFSYSEFYTCHPKPVVWARKFARSKELVHQGKANLLIGDERSARWSLVLNEASCVHVVDRQRPERDDRALGRADGKGLVGLATSPF